MLSETLAVGTGTDDSIDWKYGWTAENRLASVDKKLTTGKTYARVADLVYDAAGQRVKKTYQTPTGSTVTTTYIGKMYEKRTFSNGSTPLHTLYVYTPGGQLVESWNA